MMNPRMKISGCFQTLQGAEDFAIMRPIIDTAGKNGLDVLQRWPERRSNSSR